MPSILISGMSLGAVAENAFGPDFTNRAGTIVANGQWNRTGNEDKYFEATGGQTTTWYASTVSSYRDVEVEFYARRLNLIVRLGSGIGLQLQLNEESDVLRGLVLENIAPSNQYTGWGIPVPGFQEIYLPSISGYSHADASGRKYVIGMRGYDIYLKMVSPTNPTGIDIFRSKQWIRLKPGTVNIEGWGGGYGIHDLVVTPLSEISLYSDVLNEIYDPRDFGLKSGYTTGSITSGTATLTVADASNLAIGDKIIVPVGHETGMPTLLLHGSGTKSRGVINNGIVGHGITVAGNTYIDTTQSVFDIGAIRFDSSGDYITPSVVDDITFSGDFTIHFRMKLATVGVARNIIDLRASNGSTSDQRPILYVDTDNMLKVYGNAARITGTTALSASTWYHVTLARSGTDVKLYLNGTQEGSTWTYADTIGPPSDGYIGAAYDGSAGLNGWLAEVTFIKSALWTANFTPPTRAASGPGQRGSIGVGGTWPSLSYATEAARAADTTKPDGTWAWAQDTGRTARWNSTTQLWERSNWAPSDYYWSKSVPKALRATIINKVGNVLTLDQNASATVAGADVWHNNRDALNFLFIEGVYGTHPLPTAPVFNLPTGQFATNGFWKTGSNTTMAWEIKGQGKDSTKVFAPYGALHLQVHLYNCDYYVYHDFEIASNSGDDYYLGPGDPFTFGGQDPPDITGPSGGFGFNAGLYAQLASNVEIYNVRARDIWTYAIGGSYCYALNVHDCEVVLRDGWRVYIQWMLAAADSTNCFFTDCSVDSPTLIGGFEGFRSDGTRFIRCTGTNATMSMNSSGNFRIEDFYLTMEEECELTYITDYSETRTWAKAHETPLINCNSNIQPPNPAMELGGVIYNPTIIVEGYPNIYQDTFRSFVTVNSLNPNISIIGNPPWVTRSDTDPLIGGYFESPNAVASGWPNEHPAGNGGLVLNSDGAANLLVDGVRVVGFGAVEPWMGGNFKMDSPGGIVRNSIYHNHTAYGYTGDAPGIVLANGAIQYNNLTYDQWPILVITQTTSFVAVATMVTSATKSQPPIMTRGVEMITPVFDKTSNLATWEERIELYDTITGDPVDLSVEVDNILVAMRDPYTGETLLDGDLLDGTVFLLPGANGGFGWKFTDEQMSGLDPKVYEVGVLLEIADETAQLILGRVSVVRGL